jgi:SAM-dependent methyltransferase
MTKWRMWALAGVVAIAGCGHAAAPATTQAASRPPQAQQQERPTSTPYAGDLSIFEYPDRAKKLRIDRVMKLLKIEKGSAVADIGAGSGWFTVRAAKRVGPTGTVFAEDINPKATEFIDDRAKKEGFSNIKTVLGVPDDPKLAPSSVEAVLMLKVYHEIAAPVEFMQRLREALKPNALVGIIDRNGNGSGTDHGIPRSVVEQEMTKAGFREVKMYDFTKADGQDYFLIFEVAK